MLHTSVLIKIYLVTHVHYGTTAYQQIFYIKHKNGNIKRIPNNRSKIFRDVDLTTINSFCNENHNRKCKVYYLNSNPYFCE